MSNVTVKSPEGRIESIGDNGSIQYEEKDRKERRRRQNRLNQQTWRKSITKHMGIHNSTISRLYLRDIFYFRRTAADKERGCSSSREARLAGARRSSGSGSGSGAN